MSDLLTLKQAIDARTPNCKIKQVVDSHFEFEVDGELGFSISGMNLRSDTWDVPKWKIIPAEEIVLSVDEIITQEIGTTTMTATFDYNDAVSMCEAMHDNGRLERDLEFRPLLDELKRYIGDPGMAEFQQAVFSKIIKSLPPLTKD